MPSTITPSAIITAHDGIRGFFTGAGFLSTDVDGVRMGASGFAKGTCSGSTVRAVTRGKTMACGFSEEASDATSGR
jgi:hypothetical protein